MLDFLALWPLAVRRLRARWQLLLPLLLGAIMAVGLLSSTFIYGDAVRRLGLEHALASRTREQLDVNLLAYYAPTQQAAYNTIKSEVDGAIDRNITWFVRHTTRGMKSATFFVDQVGPGSGPPLDPSPETIARNEAAARDPRLRATFLYRDELRDKTTVVAGQSPGVLTVDINAQGAPINPPDIPVTVLEGTANRKGLQVGDRLLLVPHWEDVSRYGVAVVAAIARPKDASDRYWRIDLARETVQSEGDNFIPLYLSEQAYIGGLGRIFPKALSDYSWALNVDPGAIDVGNARLAQFGLDRTESQLRSRLTSFLMSTALDRVLADFATKDLFGRIPLLIVVMMILAILVYYLVMVAGVVVDRHLGEIALLRSRGAGTSQVLALYLWEALAIVVVAFFVGPLLAWIATSLLGYTPAFSDLTGGTALHVRMTPEAVGMAILGAIVALGALLLPTLKGSRMDLLRFKSTSARPSALSFFNRYYLDIFIGIIAAFFFWELTQRGTLVTTSLLGQRSVDKALLAAPALILLAVALLFLRIFPYVVRGAGWVASRFGASWMALGLWQMGRNPLPYMLPILLLMLAASVAMFAANFGATVDRSYVDRASYAAGADLRVTGLSPDRRGQSQSFTQQFTGGPGAQAASPVYRGSSSIALQLFGNSHFDVLGVEPATFRRVAWFRDDFSGQSLDSLMGLLERDTPGKLKGLPLPDDTASISVWALPTRPRRDLSLRARVGDVNGRYQDYVLGNLDSPEWKLLGVRLAPQGAAAFALKPPLRLVSMTIRQQGGLSLDPGAVYLDNLQAVTPSYPQPVLLYDFQDRGATAVIDDTPQAISDSFESSTSVVRPGESASGVFTWGGGSLQSTRGLAFTAAAGLQAPLNAIFSRSVMESEGISQGDRVLVYAGGHVVPVRAAAVAEFFPTLSPYDGGFVVVNLDALLERINVYDNSSERTAGELWVATGDGSSRQAALAGLGSPSAQRVSDREKLLQSFRTDPLVAAGWNGMLSMAFIAVIFAALMGFAIYSFVQAQRRRVEFAMLRSLGLSFPGLVAIVSLEQLIVIVVGLALGSWLGIQLTSILMPYLGLNESGTQVLPPFAVQVNWTAILITYAIMAVVFLAATLTLIGVFSRMAIQRALRFGEV